MKIDMRAVMILMVVATSLFATRIKDVSYIKGVRSNDLLGYGLVVGLDGTGDDDKALFTVRSLASMLQKMGVKLKPSELKVKNVAAVMVTAKLPPFAKSGNRIDVEVASLGNAKSLRGGVLLMTPLKGANQRVYAVAQGNLSMTGYSVQGKAAQAIKNHNTVARIPNGGVIERELKNQVLQKSYIDLVLKNPDFTTAYRITRTINEQLGKRYANSVDSNMVRLMVPPAFQRDVIRLVALVENLRVKVDTPAKIVINERTGTIIIGSNVTISAVAISHGNINIIIEEDTTIQQPLPFTLGETSETRTTRIKVREPKAKFSLIQDKVTLKELVKALNALGVSPRDLIAIIQAIKEAGALQAELEVI